MPTFRKLLRVIFGTSGMPLLFEPGSPVREASKSGSSKNEKRLRDVPDHTAASWARPAYGTAGRARAQETNARITGFGANERNLNKQGRELGAQSADARQAALRVTHRKPGRPLAPCACRTLPPLE